MKYIEDKIFHDITRLSYQRLDPNKNFDELKGWKLVEPKGALLHDTNGSGFDASVFHNVTTNQVIIGFRGTEPLDRNFWSKLVDYETDVQDVVFGRYKKLEEMKINNPELFDDQANLYSTRVGNPEHYIAYKSMIKDRYENNQFHQAQNLYDVVKTEYPDAEISSIGHSLGGALAEYVGVRNEIPSVSFNAPSIVELLPDDLIDKVNRGYFEITNVAYVHPGDTVGSGISDAERHVGATYYIDSTYDVANKKYNETTFSAPLITSHKRDNAFANFLFGPELKINFVPLTLPLATWGPLHKFYNSIAGVSYHSYDYFQFDEDGNISNSLFTMDGKAVDENPRIRAYEEALAAQEAFKTVMGNLLHRYGGEIALLGAMTGGGKIQLRPEALKYAGQTITRHVQEFQTRLPSAIQKIQQLLHTSQSKSLQPIIERLIQDMHSFSRWYEQSAVGISDFINKKADNFIQVDQG